MPWNVSDPVQVRANSGQAWSGGVVYAVMDDRYCITLDTPMTADAWTGTTRAIMGDKMLTVIDVLKHCEDLVPDKHIRTPA